MITRTSFVVPRGPPCQGATGGAQPAPPRLTCCPPGAAQCSVAGQRAPCSRRPVGGVLGTTEVLGRPRLYFSIGFLRILGISY